MEKSEGNKPKEEEDEDFQIRDLEIYQEEKVESYHLQSNRQLQKNQDPKQNVKEQDFLQTTEKKDEVSTEEGQKQETDIKEKFERSAEICPIQTQDSILTFQLETVSVNQEYTELVKDEAESFPVRTKDSIPTTELETVEGSQKYVEFAKVEKLEHEKNIAVETRMENTEEILLHPAKDSITAAEYDSKDATQEKWDKIAEHEHLETNEALKQRMDQRSKLSILSSKKESLQQPWEELVKVKEEQDKITQKEVETKHKLSETPTETRLAQYDARDKELIQRGKKIEDILADFFNNQSQVNMQQRTDNQKEILFASVQDKMQTDEPDSNAAAHEELDILDRKERIETDLMLLQISNQPRNLSVLSTETGLQMPCEVSEKTVKVKDKQHKEMQQKRAKPDNEMKILAETGTQKQLDPIMDKELRSVVIEHFGKKYPDLAQRTESSETNAAMQQRSEQSRKPLTLSTNICLQQPYEVSKENVKVKKEQDVIIKQKSAAVDISNRLSEADAQNQELIQREKELRNALAELCNKENQDTVQQRDESPKQILNAPAKDSMLTAENNTKEAPEMAETGAQYRKWRQEARNSVREYFKEKYPDILQQTAESASAEDSILTDEHDSIDAADQDWNKKDPLETNETLQQRSDQPRIFFTLGTKKGRQQPCEVSKETMCIREQNISIQQNSATPCNDSMTLAKADAQNQKLMQREKDMKNVLANFFSQKNQINLPITGIDHLKNTHSIENSEDEQTQKQKQTITYRDMDETRKTWRKEQAEHLPECLSKSEDGLLERSQELKEDSAIRHQETEEGKNLEIYPQNNANSINNSEEIESQKPKQTITYRELQELREKWRREHGDASVEEVLARSQVPKPNATVRHPEGKKLECSRDLIPRRLESDDIATRPQRMNYYSSGLDRGSVRPQKIKDYVTLPFREPSETARSSKTKDYVTLQTRRLDTDTVPTCQETIETARSSKTKDYVTLRPRRSDNETVFTKIPNSGALKDYITTHIIEQNTTATYPQPSTHIFCPVQEIESRPGSSSHMPTHPIDQNTTLTDPQPPTHTFSRVPENTSGPGRSTQILVPPLSGQEPATSPKSNLHVPLGKQQLEGGDKVSPRSRTSSPQDQTSPTYRRRRVLENGDVPPLSFNEDCPEITVVTDETEVQRNRISSTGIRGFLQRIHGHFKPAENITSARRSSAYGIPQTTLDRVL